MVTLVAVTVTDTGAEHEQQRDGRSLRAERTRASLAHAYLDLLTEGNRRPTAEQIAARAKVSPRSVFKHFPDREDLFQAASEVQEARVRELVGEHTIDNTLPLDERINLFVSQRSAVLEFVSPVRRAALLIEPFSEVVAARLRTARDIGQAQVEYVFAPELQTASENERENLRAALVTIASWPTWDTLRTHQGLPPERARAVMAGMLASQLKTTR
jgi:AcrR family transcriptional regulator